MKIIVILLLLVLRLFAWQNTFEAENANVIFKAKVESEHQGFTGTGYVNFDNEPGTFISWNINMLEDTVQTVSFVFANGGSNARPMELMINDSVLSNPLNFMATGAWINWDTVSLDINLSLGINEIKLTSLGSEGGPNLDKMIITGKIGPKLYRLILDEIDGVINAFPDYEFYEENSEVTLTAIPAEGYTFKNWSGDINGNTNPYILTMNSDKNVSASFEYIDDTTEYTIFDTPVGFASLNGGVTGGTGGDTLYLTDPQTLADIMADRDGETATPIVFLISGTITGYVDEMIPVKRTGNISFIGITDSARFLDVGLNLRETNNVIVQNITFADCPDDAVNIETSNNIWIDHCSFTDSPASDPGGNNHDGLLDIKRGSYNVTVSYNHFMNHRKTALLGHSVSETGDSTIKVTYYANWFDGTGSRHPRTRYGKVHILNNLYTNISGYGVGVTCAAQVLLEGNYFENTPFPVLISQVNDISTLSGDPQGFLKAKANFIVNSGEIVENLSGYNFDPADYYSYDALDSQKVKLMVVSTAGVGKIDVVTSINTKSPTSPESIVLEQNYPNPFNPATMISYQIGVGVNHDSPLHVELNIYNLLGQKVVTLVNKKQTPGSYLVKWDARGFPSGLYFYQLKTKDFLKIKKMILLK